jgi:hypothetical protein
MNRHLQSICGFSPSANLIWRNWFRISQYSIVYDGNRLLLPILRQKMALSAWCMMFIDCQMVVDMGIKIPWIQFQSSLSTLVSSLSKLVSSLKHWPVCCQRGQFAVNVGQFAVNVGSVRCQRWSVRCQCWFSSLSTLVKRGGELPPSSLCYPRQPNDPPALPSSWRLQYEPGENGWRQQCHWWVQTAT